MSVSIPEWASTVGRKKGKHPGGRIPDLTPEVQASIVESVSQLVTLQTAAGRVGIDVSTLMRWLRNGRKASEGIYYQFHHAVKKAQSDAVVLRAARITRAGGGGAVVERVTKTVTVEAKDGTSKTTTTTSEKYTSPQWQADAWMLERRDPDAYALNRKRDIQDAVNAAVEKVVKDGLLKPIDSAGGAPSASESSSTEPDE